MRIAASLVAFTFLGAAAAAALPSLASRIGGKGGHIASMSGLHSHHSGTPTGASLHGTPSLIPPSPLSGFSAARRAFFNSTIHSVAPAPTLQYSQLPSGAPVGAGTQSPVARRAQATEVHALLSGSHSMASVHPTPSAGAPSHSHSAHASGAVRSHTHSDASVLPVPTTTQA